MAKISTFSKRLKEAMDARSITQTELAQKTGISKSSISHYLKGDWEGKQDAVYAIALALDVSEAWLMGFEAKMERAKTKPATDDGNGLDADISLLYENLPPDKKQTVVEYIRFLANSK